MPNPISLIPLPRSVSWSHTTWHTEDPWSGLSEELTDTLPRAEYTLSVTPGGAHLTAGSAAALADGRNTFAQLVAGGATEIPGVEISDAPAYAWRGLHIDVSRHFFPIADLEKMIDLMALHRLNVLHLHLTDDQGWRIEIHGYPRLTEIGAWRDQTLVGVYREEPEEEPAFDGVRHGGFYTQEELRGLVAYAQHRGILIVPEVDLPGHMQAAIAAYPELGNDPSRQVGLREEWGVSDIVLGVSDEAFAFVREVLIQVADIFPGPYVHIGGDECPRTEWEQSAEARARMAQWGYTDASEIQGRYTQFAAGVLREHGKRILGWDEVLDSPLPDDMIVMNWRRQSGIEEATSRGFTTIVATGTPLYFDFPQADSGEPLSIPAGAVNVEDVYTWELLPKGLTAGQKDLILGLQAQLWTEYITNLRALEYMALPRLCALAERAWGSPEQTFSQFRERLEPHIARLEALGYTVRPLD